MPEISHLIAAPLLDYLRAHKIALDDVTHTQAAYALFGTPRLEWDRFAQLIALAHAQDAHSHDLRAHLSAALSAAAGRMAPGPASGLLRWTLTPAQLYTQIVRWLLPSLMPAVTVTARQLDALRLEIVAGLVEGAQDSEPFFALLGHLWAALPHLLQLPHALVEAEIGPRRGRYTITPPPASRMPRRLLAADEQLTRAWDVAASLHAALRNANAELSRLRALGDDTSRQAQAQAEALDAARAQLADATRQAAQFSALAQSHAEASAALRADVEALRGQHATLKREAEARVASLKASAAALEAELTALKRDHAQLLAQYEASQEQLALATQDREGFERLASDTRSALDAQLRQFAEQEGKLRLAQRASAEAAEQVQALTRRMRELEAALADATKAAQAQALITQTREEERDALAQRAAALEATLALAAQEHEALAQRAAALEARAQEADARAGAASRLITLLLSTARHELRAPIEQLAQLARASGQDTGLSDQLQRLAGELRLRVSHLFDLERIHQGELTSEAPQQLAPAQLFDELQHVLAPELHQRGNSLQAEATRTIQTIEADVPKLKKALHHLLHNANTLAQDETLRLKLSRDRKQCTRFELRFTGEAAPLELWGQALAQPDQADPAQLPAAVRHTIAEALITALGGALSVRSDEAQAQLWSFSLPDPS
jgi:hypothetical protein